MAVERKTDERAPRPWPISVEKYHRMIDCGALGPGDHVDLIDGVLTDRDRGQPWLLSVDRYHRMVDADVFDEDDKVELIEGVLVAMSPHSKKHALSITRIQLYLIDRLSRASWSVRCQLPLSLAISEPEPDLAVVRRMDEETAERHPRTAALIIEVAKSSLAADRAKSREYALAGVSEYWIVDVDRRWIELHRDPREGVYVVRESVDEGGTIRPIAFPEVEVRVAELLLPRAANE
jgi:Uma2 family endonuclease